MPQLKQKNQELMQSQADGDKIRRAYWKSVTNRDEQHIKRKCFIRLASKSFSVTDPISCVLVLE
jgi:hypothetical protein